MKNHNLLRTILALILLNTINTYASSCSGSSAPGVVCVGQGILDCPNIYEHFGGLFYQCTWSGSCIKSTDTCDPAACNGTMLSPPCVGDAITCGTHYSDEGSGAFMQCIWSGGFCGESSIMCLPTGSFSIISVNITTLDTLMTCSYTIGGGNSSPTTVIYNWYNGSSWLGINSNTYTASPGKTYKCSINTTYGGINYNRTSETYTMPTTSSTIGACLVDNSYSKTITSTRDTTWVNLTNTQYASPDLSNVYVDGAHTMTYATQSNLITYVEEQNSAGLLYGSCTNAGAEYDNVWGETIADICNTNNVVTFYSAYQTFNLPNLSTAFAVRLRIGDAAAWPPYTDSITAYYPAPATSLTLRINLTSYSGGRIEYLNGSSYSTIYTWTGSYPAIAEVGVYWNVSIGQQLSIASIDTTANKTFTLYLGNSGHTYSAGPSTGQITYNLTLSNFTNTNNYYIIDTLQDDGTYWGYRNNNQVNNSIIQVICNDYNSSSIDMLALNQHPIYVSTNVVPKQIREINRWTSGDLEYRSTIPTESIQNITLYVLDPATHTLVFQGISIVDLTNQFGPEATKVIWQGYVNGNLQTISQEYMSSDYKSYAFLENAGQYKLVLETDTQSREIGWLTITNTNLMRTITITQVEISSAPLWSNAYLNISGNNDTGVIRITYSDLGHTTSNLKVYIYDSENVPVYYAESTAQTAAVTYLGNLSQSYKVKVLANTSSNLNQIVQVISFNNGILELHLPAVIFDQSKHWWLNVFSVIALVFTALIFGAYFAGLANVVVFAECAAFMWFGWLPIKYETLAFIGVIAFISMMTSRRRTQ